MIPYHADFFFYDGVMVRQPPNVIECMQRLCEIERPEVIFEIGTSEGGLTRILADVCPSAKIYTFDIKSKPDNLTPKATFYQWDIIERATEIGSMITGKPKALVLCDGGNKVWEFTQFSQYLKQEDLILCHDFPTARWRHIESTAEEIADPIWKNNLKPHHHEMMKLAAWGSYKKLYAFNKKTVSAEREQLPLLYADLIVQNPLIGRIEDACKQILWTDEEIRTLQLVTACESNASQLKRLREIDLDLAILTEKISLRKPKQ